MNASAPSFPHAAASGAQSGRLPLAGIIILATLFFNPVFAIINGHVTYLSPNAIIAAEVLIVAAASLVVLANLNPRMTPWIMLIGVIGIFAFLRTVGTGTFEPKFVRDALIIPVFVLLGMTVRPEKTAMTVMVGAAVALVFLLMEAWSLPAYRDFFKVKEFYINTRGVSPDKFWDEEIGLYPSAVRDDRLLPFVDLHRLSSIFLEPVSLGNYSALLFAYALAFRRLISKRAFWFVLLASFVLLVGCDGRLAFVGLFLIMVAMLAAPFLPPYSAILYLPFAALMVCLVTWIGGFDPNGNDFPSRLALTTMLLESYGPMEYLGLSDKFADIAVDSGLAYWIYTQSALAVAVYWTMLVVASRHETLPQVRFLHAVAIYVTATMLVSASFVSIKTAALMWFLLGALQNDEPLVPARSSPK